MGRLQPDSGTMGLMLQGQLRCATITGHIDFLQIRNGAIHILD
jgi:hypothetical protein